MLVIHIGVLMAWMLFATPLFCDDVPDISEGIEAYNQGDYSRAIEVFLVHKLSYLNPDPRADFLLGVMWHDGKGVKQNYENALKHYQRSAERGYSPAQTYIGIMYYNGDGVLQNYEEATGWFLKAIEKGNAEAMGMMGIMYYNGDGVERNDILAHMCFNLATMHSADTVHIRELRDRVAKHMTGDQIAEAQRRAQGWVEKNGKSK